ncbi:hypothetical protein BGZ68_002541 [Mortierella alpina]|nr:hypothetical protein BGZ68_002541 [Mortierella alpina]
MKESEVQVLRETAGRLTKEWDAKTHTQDEQSFFIAQSSKEKLERTRQQVHESVDGVMAKRQRLTYHKEDKALDNALREDDYAGFFGASPEHVACRGSPRDRQVGEEAPRTTEGANLSSSFERAKSSIQESFPLMNLCKDNIADFCHSGELQDFMDDKGFSMALDALPTLPNLPQDQQDMLDRLFEGRITMQGLSERIDDLVKVSNPIPAVNRYIFTAFQPLRTAFMYTGTISQDINEGHYFRDYVVELLRGALSIHGIPYMWGEIYVPAVSYRKANDADATGRGKFADGVSESEGHQILLSESSKLHRAPASKDQDDKMKLKRMLRDLFNFTILEMTKNKDRVKPNLKVFGSRTFKDTTELIAMDYHGMYRTYCLGSFKVGVNGE